MEECLTAAAEYIAQSAGKGSTLNIVQDSVE
jgi:hypothetical protein